MNQVIQNNTLLLSERVKRKCILLTNSAERIKENLKILHRSIRQFHMVKAKVNILSILYHLAITFIYCYPKVFSMVSYYKS